MADNLSTHFLLPSEMFYSREPHLVNTILGSCVSVCLYDTSLHIGGINHYMLPFWNGMGLASPKYGNIATEKLIAQMLHLGSKKDNLVAKVFGGAEVINVGSNTFNIGKRNIEIAISMLRDNNIRILASDTGGNLGRKIQFNTQTGTVMMKLIQKVLSPTDTN